MSCGCKKSSAESTSKCSDFMGSNNIQYRQASDLFMSKFSLVQLDFDDTREDLIPYYTAILNYLNYKLTEACVSSVKDMLCVVFDLFEEGMNAISQSPNYREKLGQMAESKDFSDIDCVISYMVNAHKEDGPRAYWEEAQALYDAYTNAGGTFPEEHMVPINASELASLMGITIPECGPERDDFILAWTHAMTAICMRLRFQYANLFDQESDSDDCCYCNHGESTDDYESWVSNSYSNDEEYDRSNYERANSSWQVSKDRICDCYRHNDNDNTVSGNTNLGTIKSLLSGNSTT